MSVMASPASFYPDKFGGIRVLLHVGDFAVLMSGRGPKFVERVLADRGQ